VYKREFPLVVSNLYLHENRDGDPDLTKFEVIIPWLDNQSFWIKPDLSCAPSGIKSVALSAGIKYEGVLDIAFIQLPKDSIAAGIFTKNRCCSPAVVIDREHLRDGYAEALIVLSKNANLFTTTDYSDTRSILQALEQILNIKNENILISCTGVIGVPLPLDKVLNTIKTIPEKLTNTLVEEVAEAILTTDKEKKSASIQINNLKIAGMIKGAGMIEPNMATFLGYFFTNLDIAKSELQDILVEAASTTFQSLSVDSDTSTSDSLILFSTREISATDELIQSLKVGLKSLFLYLARKLVYQAEGSTKIIESTVKGAISPEQAKLLAKQIINSPLVKTAVFGADPNWGRIVMAIGKPNQQEKSLISPENIKIAINDYVLYDSGKHLSVDLEQISQEMRYMKRISIVATINDGDAEWTCWGCDMSYDYVKTNAEYTT
jgi:glutamate N-acetyltransferase / amino-acid N-acetyltransferase